MARRLGHRAKYNTARSGHSLRGNCRRVGPATTRLAMIESTVQKNPLRLPFFYGWVLVCVAFVTMAVGVNARTAFSLLYPPILRDFGWDRGLTAGIFSFGLLFSALITPFAGRL